VFGLESVKSVKDAEGNIIKEASLPKQRGLDIALAGVNSKQT
jgi:hypothetical protein